MNAPGGAVLGRLAGRRYLFDRRGVDVPSYTAMLYFGCVAGVLAGAAVAGSAGLERSRFALTTIVLLIPALAGARLWFVLEHWSVYRREPRRIWRRSEGGAALHGGLLLSVVVSVPLLALVEIPFWRFWDAASYTMLIGLIFTRVGCLMNGCCAGRAAPGPAGRLAAGPRRRLAAADPDATARGRLGRAGGCRSGASALESAVRGGGVSWRPRRLWGGSPAAGADPGQRGLGRLAGEPHVLRTADSRRVDRPRRRLARLRSL